MQRVNVEEVTRRLPDLIDAALRGEVILIAANDHQTVRLTPVRHTRKPRRLGSAKGMIQWRMTLTRRSKISRDYMA